MAGRKDAGAAQAARLEWVAAGVATIVVAALVGMLLREALTNADLPPDLRVSLAAPVVRDANIHLPFTLANLGSRTATSVALALQLRDGDAVVTTQRLIVDYVPGRSEVSGGFLYAPPRPGLSPVAVVEGYVDP